ncbi:MAG: hypothetical protein QOJ31_942 [Gaiellales bacterium]|jgi:uncharacterized RDD family membrane protein YckC|nr:hypothetical protein [Gaiellales bacterium]MDX6550258.1 hypothetical protein [Gaiellales bacterium]
MYCTSCGTQRPDDPTARFCPSCGAAYDPGHVAGAYYAGWWSRVGASLLDGLVMLVPSIPIVVLLFRVATDGGMHFTSGPQPHAVISRGMYEALGASAVYWVIALLIYSGLTMRRPGIRNGQTLGKQALDIRVTRDSGAPVGFKFAIVREVAVKSLLLGAIGNIPLVGSLAELIWYLWPLWDGTNRAPHDMIVKSHVVRAAGNRVPVAAAA